MVSMLQLDPMPMEASPLPSPTATRDLEKEPSAGTTSALGLSNSGHSAIYYLSRAQRYSSYAFTIFSSVHLVTTSLIPLATRSVPASESYLLLAREIYQTRLSEPLLVAAPLLLHVAAGLGLRLVRRSQNLRRYGDGSDTLVADRWFSRTRSALARLQAGWPPLTVIAASGYALTVAVAAHVAANRLLPLAVEGDSADIGLAYIAHGFARHPTVAWTSYAVFLGLAAGHTVWGWARWLGLAQRAAWSDNPWQQLLPSTDEKHVRPTGHAALDKARRRRRRRTWLAIQTGTVVVFVAWAAGGLGVVARGGRMQGWIGGIYDDLYIRMGL